MSIELETTMHVDCIYVYNATQNLWLQADECTWGPYETAGRWADEPDNAHGYRVRMTDGNSDTVLVLVSLQ